MRFVAAGVGRVMSKDLVRRALCAVLVALLLGACHSGNRAARREAASAPARPAAARRDAAIPLPTRRGTLDAGAAAAPGCSRQHVAVLSRAVQELDAGKLAAARARLRALGGPVAFAYLAYLGGTQAKGKWMERALAVLPRYRQILAHGGDAGAPPGPLDVLRGAIDELSRQCSGAPHPVSDVQDKVTWCGIFSRDPAASTRAFGPFYGSSADVTAGAVKEHCVEALLQRHAPARAAAIVSAERSLRAFDDVLPRGEGTVMFSVALSAASEITDALLDPFAADAHPAHLARAMRQARRIDPAVPRRVRAYERKLAKTAPVMADGICAMARADGKTASRSRCVASATAAAHRALAAWLSGVAFYADPGRRRRGSPGRR